MELQQKHQPSTMKFPRLPFEERRNHCSRRQPSQLVAYKI